MSVRERPEPTIKTTFHGFKGEHPGVFCMRMITLEKWTIRSILFHCQSTHSKPHLQILYSMVNIWMPLFPKLFNQQTIQHNDFSIPMMESRSRMKLEGKATQAKIGILIPFPMTMMTLNTVSMIRSIRILRSTLETLFRINSCKNNLKKYFLRWQTFFKYYTTYNKDILDEAETNKKQQHDLNYQIFSVGQKLGKAIFTHWD